MPRQRLRGDLGRRPAAEPGMGSDRVVVPAPGRQDGPGMGERGEQGFVQAFVPEPAVEAFDEGVLGRLAGGDVVPFDPPVLAPAQDRRRGQLGAIVADHHRGFAAAHAADGRPKHPDPHTSPSTCKTSPR